MRGGFSRYIGPEPGEPEGAMNPPESQEGACESLKDPIALAADVLFLFLGGDFSTQILSFKRRLSLSLGPKSSLVPPCKIFLGGSAHMIDLLSVILTILYVLYMV